MWVSDFQTKKLYSRIFPSNLIKEKNMRLLETVDQGSQLY